MLVGVIVVVVRPGSEIVVRPGTVIIRCGVVLTWIVHWRLSGRIEVVLLIVVVVPSIVHVIVAASSSSSEASSRVLLIVVITVSNVGGIEHGVVIVAV